MEYVIKEFNQIIIIVLNATYVNIKIYIIIANNAKNVKKKNWNIFMKNHANIHFCNQSVQVV